MEQKSAPLYIRILGWLISLSAFALGFWHTHHGLIPMRPLGTEYGSYVLAGLISMVLIVAYSRAVSGVRIALLFYLVCAAFNFTFNMNSFYPTLLSRKLVKEETIALNDTLQNYSARLQKEVADMGDSKLIRTLSDMDKIKNNLLRELEVRGGFGPFATAELAKFNTIAGGSPITPDRNIGSTQAERMMKRAYYEKELDKRIGDYVIQKMTQKDKAAVALLNASREMDSIQVIYSPMLKEIIKDNSDVKVNEQTRNHPQIKTLQNLVTDVDNIVNVLNKEANRKIIEPLNNETDASNALPRTQYLGQFDNTLESVAQRIKRTDTWGVLMLVAFIDFIVPLAIYFLIRGGGKKEEDLQLADALSGRKRPSKF